MNMMNNESRLRGGGCTPGGIGEFIIGLVMVIAGAYLITNQVVVVSGFWSVWGYNAFGLSLLPLIFGIGILFFNGKSIVGWLRAWGWWSSSQDPAPHVYFQSTSLFNHHHHDCALAGGIGLIFEDFCLTVTARTITTIVDETDGVQIVNPHPTS